MKSDHIKRSVRAHQHDRAAGDAPNLGRVARIPGTGLPRGTWHKRKGGQRDRPRSWTFPISIVAMVILGLLVWLWLQKTQIQ